MKGRGMLGWLGLTGVLALLSYAAAVVFSPLAYPGYDWMGQAVSDLSADDAPSRHLWGRLSALFGVCNVVCTTCVALYVSRRRDLPKLFRTGIYLFMAMTWVTEVGYKMFPLVDSGKDIASFQEWMHMAVTITVVLLSVASLVLIIVSGFRRGGVRALAVWACVALAMMLVGALGQGVVPGEYFGVVERFSVFAAVGYTAVLGVYLFTRKDA